MLPSKSSVAPLAIVIAVEVESVPPPWIDNSPELIATVPTPVTLKVTALPM